MPNHDSRSRRTFLQQAAAAGAVTLVAPPAFAQQPERNALWSAEDWAQKGAVKLYMFRKRRDAPKAGAPPLPVLFLVHGSSNSGRSTFDLVVPGRGEYSMMDVFARQGFDVWTMDFEGYGR